MSSELEGIASLWWERLPLTRMLWLIAAPVAAALVLSLIARQRPAAGSPGADEKTSRRDSLSAMTFLRRASLAGWIRWIWLAAWAVVGYRLVVRRAALFDDAFISFRYARHFAEGHGLVFNLGERVEGYTNFLWTLMIGILHRLTPFEAPAIGLVLCLLAFGLNLLVVARLGRHLATASGDSTTGPAWHLPLAVPLLAVHSVYTSYGTTGLETGAASLLVNLGALFLVARRDAAGAATSGAMFILATLMRPDHGLFYAIGGLVVLTDHTATLYAARRSGRAALWRTGGNALAAYALPFAIYALYLLWKLAYYGDILPNTYYAKSVDLAWYAQGRRYATTFYLGTQAWLPLLLCLLWLPRRPTGRAMRRFKIFFAGSFLLYNLYVTKIGGDFMYGRFYVSLIPLYLLGAEALFHQLAQAHEAKNRRRILAGATLGLLLASTQEVTLIPPRKVRWGIADESTYYLLESFRPLSVGNRQELDGRFFRRVLKDRGLEAILGTGGPGTVGYFSRLEIIDTRGLTDAFIAHQPLAKRARPGHEKFAPPDYLLERRVHLLRAHAEQGKFHPSPYRRLTEVEFDDDGRHNSWLLAHYDRDLMRKIRHLAPEIHFTDFEAYLDRYIAVLPRRRSAQVRRDLMWMRRYYFDHNDDPERLTPLEAWAARRSR